MRERDDERFDVPAVLIRYGRLIGVLGLVGLLAGAVAAYATVPLYMAEASVLYRFGREYFPVSPGETQRNWGENVQITLDTAMNTEMRLMQSRAVRDAVVVAMGDRLNEVARPSAFGRLISIIYGSPRGDRNYRAVSASRLSNELRSIVLFQRAGGSLIVTVTGRHHDPKMAEQLVEETIEAYISQRKSLFAQGSVDFFRQQIEDAETRLRILDVEIAGLTGTGGLDDLVRERQAVAERLTRLEGPTSTPADETARVYARQMHARLVDREAKLRGLEIRRSALAGSLEQLVVAADRSALDRAFAEAANPRIEIVDAAQAANQPLGLAPILRMLLGGFIGLAIGAAAFMFFGWLTIGRQTRTRTG